MHHHSAIIKANQEEGTNDSFIVPILQMGKLKLQIINWFSKSHISEGPRTSA